MLGSDWEAAQLIGDRVTRIYDEKNDRYSWWAVAEDDSLYQNYTPDGETLIRVERLEDGSTEEKIVSGDVWTPNEEGLLTFWGVSNTGHAAMWVKGDDQVTWTLTKATWTSAAGAPREYIPLQRGLLRGDPGVSFRGDRRKTVSPAGPSHLSCVWVSRRMGYCDRHGIPLATPGVHVLHSEWELSGHLWWT